LMHLKEKVQPTTKPSGICKEWKAPHEWRHIRHISAT
jgi:hypothetical protein